MKKESKDEDLPSEIAELLAKGRPVEELKAELATDRTDFDLDPAFVADFLKAQFVEDTLQAMAKAGVNKNELARRLAKSRQYVTKILSEAKSVNFTIETMAAISCALGRKMEQRMVGLGERLAVVSDYQPPAQIITYSFDEAPESMTPEPDDFARLSPEPPDLTEIAKTLKGEAA